VLLPYFWQFFFVSSVLFVLLLRGFQHLLSDFIAAFVSQYCLWLFCSKCLCVYTVRDCFGKTATQMRIQTQHQKTVGILMLLST